MQAETYISRDLELRQRRAKRYSERCRRRRDAGAMRLLCASAGVFLLALIVAAVCHGV